MVGTRMPSFHTLEISKVALLVERGALEAERVDNVVDLDGSVIKGLVGLLSGSVGASVCGAVYR